LIDPAHSKSSALPEENFVAVKRKNVFLREPALDCKREHCLRKFSAQCPFGCEICVFDQLLGNRRAALPYAFITGVAEQGAGNSENIDAVVIEEAAVFNRSDRVNQDRWDVVESNLPVRAALGRALGQRLRR
jgi:hypothetical protein